MVSTVSGKDRVTSDFHVLVDSDAFVGRFYADDTHYQHSRTIFQQLREQRKRLVTTSFVVAETATVLSHRNGQNLARKFLAEFIGKGNIDVIHITETLQQEAASLFVAQGQRGTSMTDCANVVVMQKFNIPTIFSFDKVYTKQFGLKTVL